MQFESMYPVFVAVLHGFVAQTGRIDATAL